MSFHKQIDPAMAHAVTTDAALMPKRIEIVEIPGTRIFAKIAAALAAVRAQFGQSNRLTAINTLPNHLRQDIGLGPLGGGYQGRGYY
ncbi:MAG: hypothetical protein VCE74_13835 [Alphaproteobacteria bacterium]